MKRLIIAALSTLCLVSVAQADYKERHDDRHHKHGHQEKHHGKHRDHNYYDYARVIHVEPIYERRRPYRECRTETITHSSGRDRSHAEGLIIGGLVGGILGNELGHGRDGAVIAGTVLGSAIGHDIDKHNDRGVRHSRVIEHCDERRGHGHRRPVDGYDVTYRYKGRTFNTRTDYHPGNRIRISVNIDHRF